MNPPFGRRRRAATPWSLSPTWRKVPCTSIRRSGFGFPTLSRRDECRGLVVPVLRCNGDHHCLALIGGAPQPGGAAKTLHHLAFRARHARRDVPPPANHLKEHGARIVSEMPAAAPAASSRSVRDLRGHHTSNSTLVSSTISAMTASRGPARRMAAQTASLEDYVAHSRRRAITTLARRGVARQLLNRAPDRPGASNCRQLGAWTRRRVFAALALAVRLGAGRFPPASHSI